MRRSFTTILLLFYTFSTIYAQENIKKIIYEDLFALNDIYNNCIIQFEQKKIIIKDNDTIWDFKNVEEIRQDFENRVTLINVDSINNYYLVEASFDLIANAPYFGLFSENNFKYILYKNNNKYYKINGFLVSEILLTNTSSELIRSMARIKSPKKFTKYLNRRNIDKIKNYLSVSVLENIKNLGFNIYYKPYIKDFICSKRSSIGSK